MTLKEHTTLNNAVSIDNVLENAQSSLHGNMGPEKRLRIRSAQVQAMRLRHDKADVTLCLEIIREIMRYIEDARYKNDSLILAFDVVELAYCIAGFWDFDLYLQALEFRRKPEDRFYDARRDTLKLVSDAITDLMINDRYDLLILNCPPRTGKSTMGIMTCGWVGGRDPKKQCLLSGYASPLTDSFYKELNEVTKNDEYNFEKIFSDVKRIGQSAEQTSIDYDYKSSKRIEGELTRYPTWACRAIGGCLNGQVEAASLLYCDDLTRGYEASLSIDQMNKLYSQYQTDLGGRKKEGCKEFHIGTRWTACDPLGRIIDLYGDSPRFKMIAIPALDPVTDESNFTYHGHKDGFSTETYKQRRDEMMADKEDFGPVKWYSLYQQESAERGSIMFPEGEFKVLEDVSLIERIAFDEVIAFVDVAFGGKDYLSMPVAAIKTDVGADGRPNHTVYIVDWLFVNKLDYKKTQPLVYSKIRKWGVTRITFEANNGGDFYGRDVEKMLMDDGHKDFVFVSNKTTPPNATKLNRIEAHEPAIKEFVFLPEMWYNDMYRNAMKNLTTFSRDGVNAHDDAPDSLAGLAMMLRKSVVSAVQILSRENI